MGDLINVYTSTIDAYYSWVLGALIDSQVMGEDCQTDANKKNKSKMRKNSKKRAI